MTTTVNLRHKQWTMFYFFLWSFSPYGLAVNSNCCMWLHSQVRTQHLPHHLRFLVNKNLRHMAAQVFPPNLEHPVRIRCQRINLLRPSGFIQFRALVTIKVTRFFFFPQQELFVNKLCCQMRLNLRYPVHHNKCVVKGCIWLNH